MREDGGLVKREPTAEHGQQRGRHDQRATRVQHDGGCPDQGGPDDEGCLVGGTLEGEGGIDQPPLRFARRSGDRPPADPGQRTHLRH